MMCWVIIFVMSTVGQTVGRLGRDDATRLGKRGQCSYWNFPAGDYRSVNYKNQMLKTMLLLELHTMLWTELFVTVGSTVTKPIWYMLFI